MPGPAPATLSEFLAGYPPAIRTLTRRLRAVVRRTLPQAPESFYKDDVINYGYLDRPTDYIVYLAVLPDYVRLGFFWGGYLPDPEHLLVGEGKRLRHIKVYTPAEVNNPAFPPLLQAAWDHAAKRK